MFKALMTVGVVTALASACWAAEVWRSDFSTDGDTDGVVQFVNHPSGPPAPQISGPVGGWLEVNTLEAPSPQFFYPRRSGRPLDATQSGSDSFSGLYTFRWVGLTDQPAPSTAEVAGFLGTTGDYTPTSRQLLGTNSDYWHVAGEGYYARISPALASVGYVSVGWAPGTPILLGDDPAAIAQDVYQLAIGWNGADHVLSVGLYDADGMEMSLGVVDADTDFTQWDPFPPSSRDLELGALALTHLGWSDYAITANGTSTVWSVDSLAYYDDATGAFDNVVPEPTALVLIALGTAGIVRRRSR